MGCRTKTPIRTNNGEQGQTIVLVAVSLFAILSMAALAIDVTTLYVASTEAQQAADSAALAGAKVFVTSGFTSYPTHFATTDALCNGSNGLADYAAQSALGANTVAGIVPNITISCDFTNYENPTITVQVQRSALPIFFAKLWGARSPQVSATSTAEAYNPSGSSVKTAIQVAGVKPWLLPNCDPTNSGPQNTNCPGGPFAPFVDPSTGAIENGGSFIGTQIVLQTPVNPGAAAVSGTSPPQFTFYPLDIPENPPIPLCPACASGNRGIYRDSQQCFNPYTFTCGQIVNDTNPLDPVLDSRMANGTGALKPLTDSGTQCLIHQGSTFTAAPPLDCSGGPYNQDCFEVSGADNPILITPGHLNPNQSLRPSQYITRSDSVVTVPLFDVANSNLCKNPSNCSPSLSNSASVVGFLQLGIQANTGSGQVQAVILNASGCNSSFAGTPVSGGNVASIPVRLIQTP